ncbi:zinc finger BED domain-containing protein RICESLEEPER 2 [Tanacetum coccineum]
MVASESSFSISGRVISSRRTKLTPLAVEVCICLKDHLDIEERIQILSRIEGDMLWVEEEIHEEEIAMGFFVPLTSWKVFRFYHLSGGCCSCNRLKVYSILKSWIFVTLSDAHQERFAAVDPKTAKDAYDHIEKIFLDNKHTKTIALKGKL